MTSTTELRLVEPHDFQDPNSVKYHARAAWLMMRDKPICFKQSENVIKIEPAPIVGKIKWLNNFFALPYADKSVTITKKNSAIYIDYSQMKSEKARASIYSLCLDLCNWIYANDYRHMFDISQDVLRTYTSIASAMTLEFPQQRQFLTYSLNTGKTESFTLHTPGVSESSYTITSQIIMQKTNHVIRKLWTLNDVEQESENIHNRTALDVLALRNTLERYSWKHENMHGVSAPVCWQFMDTI